MDEEPSPFLFFTPWAVIDTRPDDAGTVSAADMNNNRVRQFDASGGYLTPWAGPARLQGTTRAGP